MNNILRNCRSLLNKNYNYILFKNEHIIFRRNYAAVRKRFYRKTGILYNDGKYEVTLDQRKLKTPNGNLFTVESEPLALAVAAEWDTQKEKIQQNSMYLSTLCNTAIDNPNNLTKYDMVQYIVNYLDTDTILFQSNENEELYKLQVQEWDPVLDWFCNRFQVKVQKSREMCTPAISDEVKATISKHLLSYNFACIHGYVFGVDTLKSVILTLACAERFLTPEKAALLSRLEEEFQLGKWGRVEWAHDLNQQDLQARLSATVLFIHFNSSSWLTKQKSLL
ncbi:hypothetical protein ILUMI_12161 [Ignelater luminosus]|uniref:ATP synthase mitochondrial F1 complex assembly factor 2 n=1 Tax=Ignelater luminosus TaxID=2038154 RepID=A0A8K0CUM9_IGNLU|nr:hypothetical protein ILUMI_12161 [Ignelater luminosus]